MSSGTTAVPVADGPKDTGGYKGLHPIAAFFHIAFKAGAILAFLIGSLISSTSYVGVFISVVLLLAADFWTTKNVTGRLLVGLRWWNEVKEDGTSEWVFESGPTNIHPADSYFFWLVTYANCIAWLLLSIFNVLSLTKLPMTLLGLSLGGANAFGYTKCSRDAKKKLTSFLAQQAASNPQLVATAVTSAYRI